MKVDNFLDVSTLIELDLVDFTFFSPSSNKLVILVEKNCDQLQHLWKPHASQLVKCLKN